MRPTANHSEIVSPKQVKLFPLVYVIKINSNKQWLLLNNEEQRMFCLASSNFTGYFRAHMC